MFSLQKDETLRFKLFQKQNKTSANITTTNAKKKYKNILKPKKCERNTSLILYPYISYISILFCNITFIKSYKR